MLHHVKGDGLVLDFLGTVPAKHVQHHRVGADRVMLRGVQNPLSQNRGVMLDCRDDRHLLEQPAVPSPQTPPGPVAHQLSEQPGDLVGVRRHVDVVGREVVQHTGMRLRMHRLLADEPLHIEPQLVVLDQRQSLLEHVDEELFAGRQQQVQDIENVGGERFTRHVVQRQLRPVEVDVARLENQSFVIGRIPPTWQMRTDSVVVDREHRASLPSAQLYKSSLMSKTRIASSITRYPRYRESPGAQMGAAPRRCSKISDVWVPATSAWALRFSTTKERRSSVSRAATCRMKSSAPARK